MSQVCVDGFSSNKSSENASMDMGDITKTCTKIAFLAHLVIP